MNWIRRLLYLLIALAVAFMAWRHRQAIRLWVEAVCKALAEFWRNLWSFLRRPPRPEALNNPALEQRVVRFRDLPDPFATGEADQMSNEALVKHTFQALELWARESRLRRSEAETPIEFAARLAAREPLLGEDARHVAWFYARLAYASQAPRPEVRENARRLWEFMAVTAPEPAVK